MLNETQKVYKTNVKDDYYSFINKNWINRTRVSKNNIHKTNFVTLFDKVNKQLKNISKNIDPTILSIFKSKWDDKKVEEMIILLIEKMKKIILENDFYKLLAFLILNGFGNIISLDIEQFIYNPKKRIIAIDAQSQTFNPEYYKERRYHHYLSFYHKHLRDCFSLFHMHESNIIDIETFLSSNIKDPSFLRKVENTNYLMTNEESIQKCNFNWEKLLLHLNVKKMPKKIVIHQPEYIKKMMIYFKNWNSDFFLSFWKYKIIMSSCFFHSKLHNLSFLFKKYVYNIQKKPSASDRLLSNISFFENFTLNKLYHTTGNCRKIVDIAITLFIKRLKKNKWLSSETIIKSIKKIKKIKIYIGCKPKMEEINIVYSQNMFDNYIKWNNAILNNSILKLNDPVLPDTHYVGNMNSYDVNANYSQTDNSIFIPFGILQPPFLTNNFIHTMAFLGIIVCHELIHALDDEGSKYDENGVFKNWWSKSDRDKYNQLSKNVLQLYRDYSKNDYKTDLKMGENIADLSSMALVEDILDYYLKESREKEKYFKQFYTEYAKLYRTQNYKSYFEIVKNDYHSYGKYRVNCILANSYYFRKYYNISPDDKMYHKIIDIW